VATMRVHIVSPEREVFSGSAEMVVARGIEGDVGILAGHAPMLIQLAIHPIRIVERQGSERVVLIDGGFLHVTPGEEETRVDVLAEHAELSSEVDAVAARALAEELRRRVEEEDDAAARDDLAKALMRAEYAGR
jgi:F-type H+-transporting ATPase subunit epsilon